MNISEMKKWMESNLISSSDAHIITGQSKAGFNSSVNRGKIKPFISFNIEEKKGNSTKLFLKEDLEIYRHHIELKKKKM